MNLFRPLLLLLLLLCTAAATPQEPASTVATPPPPAFRVAGLDDRPEAARELLRVAAEARRILREQSDLDWPGAAEIRWTSEKEFLAATNHRPENTAAAAQASTMTIWINEVAWLKSTPEQRLETMAHECAHLLIGNLAGGRDLPLWANEGLAMHLAGQWTYDDHLAIIQAHAVGMLTPLSAIEREFPQDAPSRQMAYRTSFITIASLAPQYGDEPGQVGRLLKRLADPVRGPDLAESLWDPLRREDLQLASGRHLGSRFVVGVVVLTGSGFIILIASILCIVAFFKVKARNAARRREEEDDEPWAASLTDEDVQDVYGDREERWKDKDD